MSSTLSIRLDEATERELELLARDAGSRNAAVVAAIHAAYRRQAYERLRVESLRLTSNPEYLADVQDAR